MNSMKSNQVWDLVDLPHSRKTIGNKWVLNIKCKADGTIDNYKARMVARTTRNKRELTMKRHSCLWSGLRQFVSF